MGASGFHVRKCLTLCNRFPEHSRAPGVPKTNFIEPMSDEIAIKFNAVLKSMLHLKHLVVRTPFLGGFRRIGMSQDRDKSASL